MNEVKTKRKPGPKPRQFPGDKATNEWLNAQKIGTRNTYRGHWARFLGFAGMTGDQILASRKTDKEYNWEKKTLEFKAWIINIRKKSDYLAREGAVTVRSFFSFHRMPLQFRRQESTKLREAKRKTEDYRFSRDDLRKMADVSGLEEKYVVVAGKSFGLRAGDFLKLTRGNLEPYINRPVPISIGEYATQKESVKAYPFIDSDAEPIIKLMLEKMDREGRIDPNERMLTFKDPIQLTRVLKRVAEKAGIQAGNKIIRFHCLRKFLTDRLSSFMSESKWKQVIGKTINEAAYVSPESLQEDYKRAMPETTFAKVVSEGEMELLAKKEVLKILAKMQGISEAEMKKIFRSRKALTLADKVKVLERLTEKKTETNGGNCANGHNCQQIISEEELPNLLAQGWRVSAVLPSGKIVVEKNGS